jgi:predicted deacylase
LAEEIIDRLHADPTVIPADLTVHIIPNLNPDGYALPPSASDFDRRMNANGVDLNRNFNCRWSPNSSWRSAAVSGGTAAFSEPEAAALRDYVQVIQPVAAAFWHSRANAVYTSECGAGVLPLTDDVMNAYAAAADYTAAGLWTAYTVTGDVEGWLASIGIPAVTVELETRNDPETDRNWAGLLAMLQLLLESESGA